jgi:hypothetical protein
VRRSRWSARAFGLTVRGDFAAPGLDARRDPANDRIVDVRLARPESICERAGSELEERCERRDARGALVMRIDRTPAGGHCIDAPGYGTFFVAASGREVLAAPQHPAAWYWQRYLIGQALPLAALLQGLEVLHASALVVDGQAMALAGASGSGKTTLATALVRTGAHLLCDDVLALETAGHCVLAHPGPPVVNLRPGAASALRARVPGGRELGRDAEARRLEIDASATAAPLAALYILDRSVRHRRVAFEQAHADAPRMLLASSFNFIVTDPVRLERQLDICAGVARAARVTWARVPARMDPIALAGALSTHMMEMSKCAA